MLTCWEIGRLQNQTFIEPSWPNTALLLRLHVYQVLIVPLQQNQIFQGKFQLQTAKSWKPEKVPEISGCQNSLFVQGFPPLFNVLVPFFHPCLASFNQKLVLVGSCRHPIILIMMKMPMMMILMIMMMMRIIFRLYIWYKLWWWRAVFWWSHEKKWSIVLPANIFNWKRKANKKKRGKGETGE